MKTKQQKGIIPIWVAGLLSAVLLGYGGATTSTLFIHSNTNTEQDIQIALNEQKIETMKEIMNDIRKGQNLLLDKFEIKR